MSEYNLTERERQARANADRLNAILSQSSISEGSRAAEIRAREQAAARLQAQRTAADQAEFDAALAMKYGGGPFRGASMEAQTLNALWKQAEAQGMSREQFQAEIAQQRAQRPTSVSTPQGTYTNPGLDLSFMGVTPKGSTPEGFTPKNPTEGAKRGQYTVGTMEALDAQAPDYTPGPVESLANEYLPDSLKGFMQSGEYREANATADEWARTLVFLRSGATARQEEVDAAKQNYWPQPGDDDADVTRKKRLRTEAMLSARKAYIDKQQVPEGVDFIFNAATGKLEPVK
ncbi:hypothetical protein [Pseudohalioglobus lutimaris]|uniref:Uncharacterized protein n=1 Tax=Pseudohalioglobus lutimaris TaxID=1737061 RepID=A0A2N5X4P9_9GAMM|nr:hypothetical protein [Pseudohalioglobus lutimaris]PLW69453.1 hypothetical protein C0039_07965 [Pseudohalioglobus lutimaris]